MTDSTQLEHTPDDEPAPSLDEAGELESRARRTADALDWTNFWMHTIGEHPRIPTDEGTMLGWFANAIESGRDRGSEAAAEAHEIAMRATIRVGHHVCHFPSGGYLGVVTDVRADHLKIDIGHPACRFPSGWSEVVRCDPPDA